MERGTVRLFMRNGVRYGLKVCGTWNNWHRFRTPDGRKFRSIRAALDHLEGSAKARLRERVAGLAAAWHCKVVVA